MKHAHNIPRQMVQHFRHETIDAATGPAISPR